MGRISSMCPSLNNWAVLEESSTDGGEYRRKVTSRRRVPGAISSSVNARVLQLECARVIKKILLVSVLFYGSKTMVWREKERCRIRAA